MADCVEKLKNEAARDFRETQIEIVLRELVALHDPRKAAR
jgi:hypothetical protein